MRADSEHSSGGGSGEPSLPRTWRPVGVRVAAIFFGLTLAVVCTFAWLGLDQAVRDKFTPFQFATMAVLALGILAGGHALGRARVEARTEGLVVVNGYRKHTLAWESITKISLPSGAPWARLTLADGSQVSVTALQATDGGRATAAVREIRTLLAR
ncbi:PH domain-containing protein [Nocardioides gilvus]|uniref:PH domain-containing protein n=1 Tax=Nocardioides gilvus TaxID=1735589 RepID=UPI000D74941E|nr:PH domain-containing protein [Nocardioides gilvus]